MRIGTDIMEVNRIMKNLSDIGFCKRIFTVEEMKHIKELNTKEGRAERAAGKFCVKEALMKALGTGLDQGVKWLDIEVLPRSSGEPTVTLYDRAKDFFMEGGFGKIDVSISHCSILATATVILE